MTSASPVQMPAAGARVLVADDIEANRELLIRRLRRLGVTDVVQAADGQQAMTAIRSGTAFDLVLLDIMMPIMTGFDVLEAMAAEGRIEGLPVIVISAMNEMDGVVRAIGLGAEDFLLKPFDPLLLKARVSSSLEKKRLRDAMRASLAAKQAELAEARALQLALVPPAYRDEAVSVQAVLEPAREVGGDLVDHEPLADGRHLLVLGDVSDKGAGAALMMARTHALVRSLATRPDAPALFADPARAAAQVNAILADGNSTCMFVTIVFGLFDPATGRLDYVRCGHVPPFLARANGSVERLEASGGLPLGLDDEAPFTASHVHLRPGDRLLVLSDGVTEAESPDGALLGDDAVADWMAGAGDDLSGLVAMVRDHEAGGPQSDDVAAILVRVAG